MIFAISKKRKKDKQFHEENHTYHAQLKEKDSIIASLKKQISEKKNIRYSLEQKIMSLQNENRQIESKNLKVEKDLKISDEKFQQLFTLYGQENNHLKESILDIQSNLAAATTRAKESLETSTNVNKDFSTAFLNINSLVSLLNKLLERSHNAASIITKLSKNAKDIEKSIQMIDSVVMQIKILSLNASVEAVSAGEAGKGFAVVANEVKNLANQTSSVSTQIQKIVSGIQTEIKNTNTEFKEIDSSISTIHNHTNMFDKEIHLLHDTTKHFLNELDHLGDNVFMSLAKIDHVLWKTNSYLSVYENKPAFKFVDHHNCRLGKWYFEGNGQKYFSDTPSYKKLNEPHAGVHNGTLKVFENLGKENLDFQQINSAFTHIEENSANIFSILNDISKEAQKID